MKLGKMTVAACIVASMSAAMTTAQAQQAQNFGKGDKVHILSDVKLSSKQQRHFRQFRSKVNYFSYFFVTPDGETSVYVGGMHNLENAKEAAKIYCKLEAKDKQDTCMPYAVSLPKTVSGTTTRASGFSESASRALTGKFVRDAKKRKGWAAMSINGAYQWGWATGRTTKTDAIDSANAFCESAALSALAELPAEFRKWALKRGFEKCKVGYVAEYK